MKNVRIPAVVGAKGRRFSYAMFHSIPNHQHREEPGDRSSGADVEERTSGAPPPSRPGSFLVEPPGTSSSIQYSKRRR